MPFENKSFSLIALAGTAKETPKKSLML